MRIESDISAIEKNLRFLEQTILDHDGWIDEDLTITCFGGEMSVTKDGFPNPTKPLIALPLQLLLPSEKLGLSVKDNSMNTNPDSSLSPIQSKLAESMVDLYNLTDKIGLHKQSCCWLAFRDSPALLEELLKVRTLNDKQAEMMAYTKGEATDQDDDDFMCKTYVKTRTIGHKQPQSENEETLMTTDIMPIVDFINHHPTGSMFHFGKYEVQTGVPSSRIEALMVKDVRPLADSNECFAFYNQLDAIDAFVNYGYPEPNAPYVRSMPLTIELDGIGTVKICAYSGQGVKGKLSKNLQNLRPFIPSIMSKSDEQLELSHLFMPTAAAAGRAMRRALRLVLSNWSASNKKNLKPDQVWSAILAIEDKVITENIAFYQQLEKKAQESDAPEHLKKMIAYIAGLQQTKIYKYVFDEEHFGEHAQQGNNPAAAAE